MSIREFSRLTERVLARMGQDAFLRGAEPCRVAILHSVQVQGTQSELVAERTVAVIGKVFAPRHNDTLTVGETVNGVFIAEDYYVVDSPPFADNGYSVKVVLRAA